MRKPLHHHIKQSILWLGLVLVALGTAHASGNEDDKPKDRTQPNDSKATATQAEALRMQKAMSKALSSLNLDFANVQPESIMQPLVADETNAAKERAMTTFEKVKYMSELSVLNTVLPVGVKETIGNTTVEVAVATLNIYPAYAEVTIYCRMHFKDKNAPNGERDVFFGAQNVKIGSGGLIDGAELALLGDVTIPFGDHSFTLKGGFDEKTGAAKSLTYVKVGCKGFEYISVNGLMKFSRNQVLPYDATNRIAKPTGNVEVAVQTIASSLDDIFVTVNIPNFCLKGNEKWGYSVSQATFDFSDIRAVNAGANVYPTVAGKPYMDAIAEPSIETWKGVHVAKFEVLFPKEFAKKGKKQVSAAAINLVLDKNGISALLSITIADTQADATKKPADLDNGRAGKWKMSINSVYLDVVLNKFNGGGLGGDILLPVQNAKQGADLTLNSKTNDPDSPDMFKYSAIISKGGDVEFTLSQVSTIDFKLFGFAKAKIAPGSIVKLTSEGGKIVPYAKLTGSLNITTKISNKDDNTKPAENNLDGIVFRELVFQDKAPNISAKYFGYVKPSHSADFPISIDEITVTLFKQGDPATGVVCNSLSPSPKRTYAVIGMGTSVSLDDSFGGSAGFNIVGHFDEDEGEEEAFVEFDCMKLTDMCIKTNFSAFALSAGLKMYNDSTEKGFEGKINLVIKKPTEIIICAGGRFTKANNKSRWYIDGGVSKDGGLFTIGALQVNSIVGGLFRRMEQTINLNAPPSIGQSSLSCAACTIDGASNVTYKPKDNISLGFSAMVGLSGGGQSFDGIAGFQIVLNESWGLRSINLFGQGEFAPKNIKIPAIGGTALTDGMKGLVDGAADLVTDNAVGKFISESDLVNKAKKCFSKKDAANETIAEANKVLFNFGFKLDIDKENGNVFHGQAEVYADFGNGKLRGIGKNGRAGWMVMHFDNAKWYIHVGTPQDKIGFALNAGPLKANVGAYFMVGHQIEPFAPLPSQLNAILNNQQKEDLAADKPTSTLEKAATLTSGQGIAFGADFGISTGDIQALIFYANFDAGLGFDLMMSKNAASACNNGNWYAKGRMYAYMQGELGIIVKLLVVTKKIPIIKGGAGVLLQGGFPNPAWFNGQVAGYYSLLNDKIKGKFNMEVKLGDAPCN